jgi:uncharacterized SAM-binding protein YcdF (DUF218 family)
MFRSVLSTLFVVAAVAYGYGIWLFLLHDQDRLPAHADAIVVLAGSRERLPVALKLAGTGMANTLVVSEDNASNDPDRYRLCHGTKPKRYKLVCQFASPSSTRGEARMIANLADQRNWKTVVVVTSRYHIYRAHKLIRRCTKVDLAMRYTDKDAWWRKAIAVPLEYIKLIRAEISQRSC